MPGHSGGWGGINEDHVTRIIHESLSLFLEILLGGTNVFEQLPGKAQMNKSTSNIAQDIIYAVSKGSKLTPKHIGLGLTLHQATRSEKLVGLFHAAGHTIGIDTIRRFDTSIATDILNRYEENDNVYIPYEIAPYCPGRVVLASYDNIDVLEETIDGKNTFHCTQMMLWQRGPVRERPVTGGAIGRARTVTPGCLEQLHKLDRAYMLVGERPNPVFDERTDFDCDEWFATNEEKKESDLKNLTWILTRMFADEKIIPGWAAFNEATCVIDPPLTTPGMLPVLQAPADENNTVITVINHFMSISEKLGQPFTIITADQPLYSRGKELIWANYEKYKNVVLIMGHLHILFNFLKAIGQHMENAGLVDVWVESGLFACNSTDQMMEGKSYYRAVRGHTLAYEALNRIYWNNFVKWIGTQEHLKMPELRIQTGEIVREFSEGNIDSKVEKVSALVELLDETAILELMTEYDKNQQDTPNFVLWRTYMKMVETLLNFIRANREGNWNLHIQSFSDMLPWMTVYDHTNYARWGTIYLAEMKSLETSQPIIHREFMNGNFVVRRGKGRFNQVPIDQATEWQNRICKISNGIIGITRNDTARDKFCMTWAERSYISHSTKCLLEVENEDEGQQISTRKDAQPSRIRLDEDSVTKLEDVFSRFNVFGLEGEEPVGEEIMEGEESQSAVRRDSKQLVSIATNDVSTSVIENDLLSAQTRGVSLVQSNVSKWFIKKETPFFDPLPKVKSQTFASLYKMTFAGKQNEKKTIKADRRLLQQLLTASLAGRRVDLNEVLQHQLSSIPLSLAKVNGDMNSTAKAELAKIITKNEKMLPNVTEPGTTQRTCALVDGHAYIQTLGKPKNCRTFEEYAHVFFKSLLISFGENVERIDIVFDQYISKSIKSTTRTKRGTNKRPIRRIINRGDLPLPQAWANFISLGENKADLAKYLSNYLVVNHDSITNHSNCELVTGGGFQDPTKAFSTMRDMSTFLCNHEEADTRLIYHALEAVGDNFNRLLVFCRDTDVFLMLIHFFKNKCDIEVWMVAGTAKQRKCYPIHDIAQQLTEIITNNLLGFHSLTGCDTTSSFTSFGKRKCWKIFEEFAHLLDGIGRDGPVKDAEEFICRLYGAPDPLGGLNKCRVDLFEKGSKDLEKLPPTSDAFRLHVARCNYQAKVWLMANVGLPEIPSPTDSGGWISCEDRLQIIWSTIPSIPQSCISLISCGCKKKCRTANCKCYKNNQQCTPLCGCDANECKNPVGLPYS